MLILSVNLIAIKEILLLTVIISSCWSLQTDKKPTASESGIFSDLWSALTQTGKNPTCPGECVHAITSILCDHVLEEVSCGEPYLRCCVPNDSSYGTAVETSPPFDTTNEPHIHGLPSNGLSYSQSPSSSQSTTPSFSLSSSPASHLSSLPSVSSSPSSQSFLSSFFVSSTPSFSPTPSSVVNSSQRPTRHPYPSTGSAQSTSLTRFPNKLTTPSMYGSALITPESINPHCPGVCVRTQYARYCGNIMSNGICDKSDETCCLQSERDSINISLAMNPIHSTFKPPTSSNLKPTSSTSGSSLPSTPVATSKISSSTSVPVTPSSISNTSNSTKSSANESHLVTNQTALAAVSTTVSPWSVNALLESLDKKDKNLNTNNAPDGMACEGTCVTPLFSILCDRVDKTKVCPIGSSCCIYDSNPTTTPASTLPECKGRCILTFLSVACPRPSELLPKTSNCMTGTICCKDKIANANPDHELPPSSAPNHHPHHPPPPPSNQGGTLHIPGHYLSNYPMNFHPPPPHNIQHFQRPSIPLNHHHHPIGIRPSSTPNYQNHPSLMHPPHHRPNPLNNNNNNFNSYIPNRKPPQSSVLGLDEPQSPNKGQDLIPPDHHISSTDSLSSDGDSFLPSPNENGFPGGVPVCPGTCLAPFFRFTCLGSNAIYPKFYCPDPGQICCSVISDIQAYESNILANNGVWKARPSSSQPPSSPPLISSQSSPSSSPSSPPSSFQSSSAPPSLSSSSSSFSIPSPSSSSSSSSSSSGSGFIPSNITLVTPSIQTTLSSTLSPLDEASSFESPTIILPPVKPPPRQATPYSCGIKGTHRRESPRIVGGSDALPGEWCWQVALINSDNQYICGGALIGSQWVLTAAHCITSLVRNGENIFIRVGDYDLSSKVKSKYAQTQQVSTTYIHHNHNGQTLDNDIALLKMQSPVNMNDSICLVCLPARGSNRSPGQRCTVTGYGYRDEAGPIALRIREADVPVVDDQECTGKINAVTEKLFILPSSSFCAGGEEGNDACQGDGGGPLVCEVDGFYELTGLVSWGFGCGRQDVPGVYVKVSNFIGWINQIISVNNQ
ncbi:trypsin-like serine protease domain-containing protein masquerade isoform X2 [Brevipalpus obovatus]|uniref:trypsin-like serine protease domain-containing protein masquerade isoform X2 n=1 Tax=Brevipalpus obovatus TaxID=246614 RepID=UPI003D9EEC66